jgi:hypothetical protein
LIEAKVSITPRSDPKLQIGAVIETSEKILQAASFVADNELVGCWVNAG